MTRTTLSFLCYLFVVSASVTSFSLIASQYHRTPGTALSDTLDGVEIRGPMTPLSNFCLICPKETLTQTSGGLLIPDESKVRPTEGKVLAVGPGRTHPQTGVLITNPISVGMSVLYGKFDGTSLTYNDEHLQMIRDSDVLLTFNGLFMSETNVTPCRDYVMVKIEKEEAKTYNGILMSTDTSEHQKTPCHGIVSKVGEGRMCSTGKLCPSPVEVGNVVKFKDHAGMEVTIQGQEYAMVRMVDILCVHM